MNGEPFYIQRNQPISEDYVSQFAKVSGLYEYEPVPESWTPRAEWLDRSSQTRVERHRLAAALRQYNASIGNTPLAHEAIDALEDDRTLAVVGGQQAGLFTGQLLVLYKAITIIRTAREAEQHLGRRVVPIFWIAGEDHDFDEVNHIYSLSGQLQVQKLKIDHPNGSKTAISRLPIDSAAWEDALRQLDESLMDTEFKPQLMAQLREITGASKTLSDSFARIMVQLFGRYGLVLLDSDAPPIRALEGDMFAKLIHRNDEIEHALFAAKRNIENLGYEAQAEVQPGCANLFYFHDDTRLLLYKSEDGERYSDRRDRVSISKSELLELAHREPARFSNNVMTRPLMQDYLLPVLSVVLGPGEIAYWALTREAFRAFDMQMPIITSRYEYTLVDGTVQKHMTKYALTFDDVLNRFEDKQQAWLNSQDNLHLDQRFAEVKSRFDDMYKPLIELIASVQPAVGKLGETNRLKILEQIEFLQGKANDAFRSRHDAALRQLERIRLSLMPLGKLQERVYNMYAYLNRYGDGWLHRLVDVSPQSLHTIVYL